MKSTRKNKPFLLQCETDPDVKAGSFDCPSTRNKRNPLFLGKILPRSQKKDLYECRIWADYACHSAHVNERGILR